MHDRYTFKNTFLNSTTVVAKWIWLFIAVAEENIFDNVDGIQVFNLLIELKLSGSEGREAVNRNINQYLLTYM